MFQISHVLKLLFFYLYHIEPLDNGHLFKPSSKIFFTDRSKSALLYWIIHVISALCLLCFVRVCLLMPCGHYWQRADFLALVSYV